MSAICQELMQKLYGRNIWDGFVPGPAEDDIQGWNGDHPALSRLASQGARPIIVDVGVWKGQSTINLAENLKKNGIDGVVLSVDTFLGSLEHWVYYPDMFQRTQGLPNLYETFLSNVAARGLTDYVIPMPQTSSTACKILQHQEIHPTLVHIDAAHEYREVRNDLEDYWSILAEGGVLIGDDYHAGAWPEIVQAADEFAAKIGRPMTVEEPKFILKK
ncbi:MAG: hypothetical protein BGP04_24190 [Rhizobiales bacterium 62-17]|nr:class I SAM-dependent methyltransferase [Hyphomicrobiales bacterium]OJY00638.1 MAG: hypothetical protein BGP04_24190 [Rhizobiales bacterium 62-17]